MRDVLDYAKYFIQKNVSDFSDTYDGNMKLQKLLAFADFAFLTEYGALLFSDDVLAFRNGCVIEKVRLQYKNNYNELIRDSIVFTPDFSKKEFEILNLVVNIFGGASAKELSEINHEFDSWKDAYQQGIASNGFHEKKYSIVDFSAYEDDKRLMQDIISSYKEQEDDAESIEVVNGVTFYYSGFTMTDDILGRLESFSEDAEDSAYTAYYDNGKLVVY